MKNNEVLTTEILKTLNNRQSVSYDELKNLIYPHLNTQYDQSVISRVINGDSISFRNAVDSLELQGLIRIYKTNSDEIIRNLKIE